MYSRENETIPFSLWRVRSLRPASSAGSGTGSTILPQSAMYDQPHEKGRERLGGSKASMASALEKRKQQNVGENLEKDRRRTNHTAKYSLSTKNTRGPVSGIVFNGGKTSVFDGPEMWFRHTTTSCAAKNAYLVGPMSRRHYSRRHYLL